MAAPLDQDRDAREIRRASRRVAGRLMATMTVVALVAIAGTLIVILDKLPASTLFSMPFIDHPINIGARDMLITLVASSTAAIIFAGIMTVVLTRRAVKPLGDALRMQRSFVADASHELRTPLTVLDARVQVIRRMLTAGEVADEVDELREDTRALIAIVNDLLDAADVDKDLVDVETIALAPVVGDVVSSLGRLAREDDVQIAVTVPDDLTIAIPAIRAGRCLLILIDNALQHSPRGSTVTVTAWTQRSQTVIRVSDEGDGIQGIDPGRVFDRFAHSDEARAGTQNPARGPGYGIGLSLVRDTAVRFGGDVRVVERDEPGAAFELLLPRRSRR